jgi:hypothetical protein
MAAASGIYKQVSIKKETAYGTLAGTTGARALARVDAVFNLAKEAYESNRIRTDLQYGDARHGVRSVAGTINDELVPGALSDVIGSICKRAFTAVTAETSLSLTIAAAGNNYTITRAAGSWLTGGKRVGQVVRLTAGTFNAANLNKNLFVLGVTATVLTVATANGSELVAEGPVASATLSVPGKYTYVPLTGHVEDSYTVEEWFSDVPRCEVFTGFKPAQAALRMPPNGLATIAITGAGKDLGQTGATRYFSNPTVGTEAASLAAVNGLLRTGGNAQLAVTGLDIDLTSAYSGDATVGSNTKNFQFAEGVKVSGSFSAYFESGDLPALFYDETVTTLDVLMTSDNSANAEFMTFSLNRVKVNSADKADGRGGIVRTYAFTASVNPTAGEREATTIAIQDSLA